MKKFEHEGNCVETRYFPNCTVKVYDSAYAGKTDEELELVRENARNVARGIFRRIEMEKQRTMAQAESEISLV